MLTAGWRKGGVGIPTRTYCSGPDQRWPDLDYDEGRAEGNKRKVGGRWGGGGVSMSLHDVY